jgi:MFS family permease
MLRNPLALILALPPQARLLLAGTLVSKLGSFVVPYLTLVLRREFQLTAGEAGHLVAAWGIGSIGSVLAGGWLADRVGRRRTLLLSLGGGGALAVSMGFADSMEVLRPQLLLFGFLGDLYRPASTALLADVLPGHQRPSGFAAQRAIVNLGFFSGLALGGLLADADWRLLFWLDGATTLAFAGLVYAGIRETAPLLRGAAAPAVAAPPDDGVRPWKDGVFLLLVATSLAFSVLFASWQTVLPLSIVQRQGYDARVYGLLVGANGLLIAAFEISIAEALRRRFRRLRVASVGMLVIGVGFALTGMGWHWGWYLFTVCCWTAGEILTTPQKMSFLADWAPPAARGRYMAMMQATWGLGVSLNATYVPAIFERMPEPWFWMLAFVPAAAGAWVFGWLDRVADRPECLRGAAPPEAASRDGSPEARAA